MRTTQLHFDEEKVIEVVRLKEFTEAVGYLSTWSLLTYDLVDIYDDREPGNLAAYYTNSESDKRYVIGAVWRPEEGRYSFHS